MRPLIPLGLTAVAGALLVVLLSLAARRRRTATVTPLDPDAAESWLVHHAPHWAKGPLAALDRRVAGGAVVAVSLLVVLVVGAFLGWVLDTVDEERGIARWDAAVAEWGAREATGGSTRVLEVVTDLGGTLVLTLVVGAVAVGFWVRRQRSAVLYLAATLVGVVVVNNGLKLLVDRERPAVGQLVGWSGASFPSGHAAAAASVWAALALVLTRRASHPARVAVAAGAAAVATAVAASRVLLGVHWLTDVVVGVAVGWGWFLLVSLAFGGRLLRLGELVEQLDQVEHGGPGDHLEQVERLTTHEEVG